MAKVCDGCAVWETFKENCHFYWKCKRMCSQFKPSLMDAEIVKSIDDLDF